MTHPRRRSSIPPPPPTPTLKLFGLEFVPPKWAIWAISVVVIVGVCALVYLKVGIPLAEAQAAQGHVQADMAHYQKHFGEARLFETAVYDNPALGKLMVGYYASDHCLVAIRNNPGLATGAEYHFIKEALYTQSAPGPLKVIRVAGMLAPAVILSAQVVLQPSGRCLNPHPGVFQFWTGPERNGCWAAIWRRWQDGCLQYQWFNTCNNSWDMNPDGSAHVYWRFCVH